MKAYCCSESAFFMAEGFLPIAACCRSAFSAAMLSVRCRDIEGLLAELQTSAQAVSRLHMYSTSDFSQDQFG